MGSRVSFVCVFVGEWSGGGRQRGDGNLSVTMGAMLMWKRPTRLKRWPLSVCMPLIFNYVAYFRRVIFSLFLVFAIFIFRQ